MKYLLFFCLLLMAAPRLLAQCSPDIIPPYLSAKANNTVALGGSKCTAVVEPKQLLQNYGDNCTSDANLTFRLRRVGTGAGMPLLPTGSQLTFTPADAAAPVFVEVWVRDAAGNTAFVLTSLSVQNPGTCTFAFLPDTLIPNIGLLKGLEDMTWQIEIESALGSGTYFDMSAWLVLPDDLFVGPTQDDLITITPTKDNDPLNGVNTYDLVLINKAILGLEPLGNPYKYIAADANRNNRVTVGDIVELRRLILGIYTELPDNTSWRFVPDDYVFPKPEYPFYEYIPESVTFDRLRRTPLPNFIAIKIGDLNGNAVLNSLVETEDRTTARLELPDMQLAPGQTVLVPVSLNNFPDLAGVQGAFRFDPKLLNITGIQGHALKGFSTENYYQPEPGLLTLSWTSSDLKPTDTREPLFFLEITALQACQLQKALQLHPGRLAAEAYPSSGGIASLELGFDPLPLPAADLISAAYPNPATDGFYIPIQLSAAKRVVLEVFEPGGTLVFDLDRNLPAGAHVLHLAGNGLANGLYYYRVSAGVVQAGGSVVLH